ncbi:sugar ABC transporter permease [Capsulimonas corticalis]|uniref:Sugar ABC transporter permease n=1 Tax=Capsulimonas corticalis TaxID=2219043 RepID=A0A402D661_9BACT|nr:carbohydrate ABC transporter permease [Capsulimonas corticalis]BDI32068.1 sugar ABC transporter permease [Capsulimonas corticalis]
MNNAPVNTAPASNTMSVKQTIVARGRRRLTGLSTGQKIAAHAVLLLLCLPALLPLFWMVSTSLKGDTQIFAHSASNTLSSLLPHPAVWSNYPKALSAVPFGIYFQNTLFLCACTVIGAVLSSSLVAYGFAKMEFKGKAFLFILMISTIALPAQVTMVPVFGLFRALHWYGTYLPLIVPAFCGAPFYIFLLTQFYRKLPDELAEAARLDGASEWQIYWKVMLPLSRPALATCALFQFLGTWNDFLGPLIYINDPNRYTLAYGLQQLLSTHGGEWASLMADSTIFVLPIIVLFFFTQKLFVQGIATTGGKN